VETAICPHRFAFRRARELLIDSLGWLAQQILIHHTTRTEGARGTPTQSHISLSILVCEDHLSKYTSMPSILVHEDHIVY